MTTCSDTLPTLKDGKPRTTPLRGEDGQGCCRGRLAFRRYSMFFFFEYILVAALIVATYFLRSFPSGWFQAVEQCLQHLARRRALTVLMVGVLALVVRAALLPNVPVPQPGFHDDFGYLLAADTFAHGRLANPTHPLWVHFESIHINQKPTYMPMYYAAQGLVMALGQVVTGNPWVGVWLSAGAMCAAICWMLQGWLPPGWALLGGLLSVMRLASFTYWVNSYCGGALAALGGALVLGALPRLKHHPRVREALLMGLGFALLANTRPYESLFFGVPIAVAAWVWILGRKCLPYRKLIMRVALPMGVLLAATVAGMTYFFWRVTGSPFRIPYQVNLDTYIAVPYFPWQPLNLKHVYHHPVLEQFYLHGWQMYFYYHDRRHPFDVLAEKAADTYRFYLGPLLALPVILVLAINPRQFFRKLITGKSGFWVAVCGATFAGAALPIYFIPHYVAPMTAAIYALVLQAMRYLRLWTWRGKEAGRWLVRTIPSLCVLLFVLRAFAPQLHVPTPVEWKHTWESEHFQNLDRARALAQLEALPGDHLVIVRYNQYHNSDNEWVYNRADIDKAKVVWARDMGDSKNAELIRYFSNRHVWLAEPDLAPPRLLPYAARASGRPVSGMPGS